MILFQSTFTYFLRAAGFAAALGFCASCGPDQSFAIPTPMPAVLAEEGRVYALVENENQAAQIRQSAIELGYRPMETTVLEGLDLIMVAIDLPDGVTGLAAIMALETAVPASTVGVNHAYRLQQTVQGNAGRRTYANALMSWQNGSCRALRSIGLIDGGVDATVPALSGTSIQNRNFETGSPTSVRHGTEVASVLADPSRLRGVRLISANIIRANEAGEDIGGAAGLVQAIDWMARQDVSLVNVSLAGPPNKLLTQAVQTAASKGMVIVAAVGNNGQTAPEQHPAALDDVIAVTAVDARGRIFRDAVRGTHVDVAAPGVDVFVPSGPDGRYVTGTSMAAPLVTAVLATQQDGTFEGARGTLIDLGPAGRDRTFGEGLIQAAQPCP